ncbi:dynamin family protein [Beggiatoa alba]|nr:dynamin family protein [Beggiatoa alba]
MATDLFTDQMQAYGRWKNELITSIESFQTWLNTNKMSSSEAELRIYDLIQTLKRDHLTIAFVAEFARGKTELINAIFFSDYNRRLLPSEAGRTTMCPTELFYDNNAGKDYIRLLPIETRLEETSINDLKKDPINWTHIDLNTDSSEDMAACFQEIIRTKKVSTQKAIEMALLSPDDIAHADPDGSVDIPMWRHALISFPHPLLKEGLTILDTPGLNAIGTEPELTLNMLPSAQAVVFVLAADTGVTKTDMEMWKHYVQPLGGQSKSGRIVVLNKIDTLWDELKDEVAIKKSITSQCNITAKMLSIENSNIFPVSAQKGLLAKIRNDRELIKRSNILALEYVFSKDIIPSKQNIVRESIVGEIGSMAKEAQAMITSRLEEAKQQLKELHSLSGKNKDVILHLMKRTRQEQTLYHKSVESFQADKKMFTEEHAQLLSTLSISALDELMAETRKNMTDAWSTVKLKKSMKAFFDIINQTMESANKHVENVNRIILTIYSQYNKQHGLTETKPRLFSIVKYKRDLERLYYEAEAYRNSTIMTMTEQAFVVRKFFISMVSHARDTLSQAHLEANSWSKSAMLPLVTRIKEHKSQMEKRLESLRKINDSRDTLQTRITELKETIEILQNQLQDLNNLMETLNKPLTSYVENTKSDAQVA